MEDKQLREQLESLDVRLKEFGTQYYRLMDIIDSLFDELEILEARVSALEKVT